MRLRDDTGRLRDVVPARPGHLLLTASADGESPEQWARSLRALVVCDLLRRVAELYHLAVTVGHRGAAPSPAELSALNIPPPDQVLLAGQSPDRPADVHVDAGRAATPADHTLSVGAVDGDLDACLVDRDPLALRLLLLGSAYAEPVRLDDEPVEAATQRLVRWRARVAEWAESPSKPMCAGYVPEVEQAFSDDLDSPTALRVLEAVEADPELPPGSRFEMFAHLDRLFGLDLTRDVGRSPAEG